MRESFSAKFSKVFARTRMLPTESRVRTVDLQHFRNREEKNDCLISDFT